MVTHFFVFSIASLSSYGDTHTQLMDRKQHLGLLGRSEVRGQDSRILSPSGAWPGPPPTGPGPVAAGAPGAAGSSPCPADQSWGYPADRGSAHALRPLPPPTRLVPGLALVEQASQFVAQTGVLAAQPLVAVALLLDLGLDLHHLGLEAPRHLRPPLLVLPAPLHRLLLRGEGPAAGFCLTCGSRDLGGRGLTHRRLQWVCTSLHRTSSWERTEAPRRSSARRRRSCCCSEDCSTTWRHTHTQQRHTHTHRAVRCGVPQGSLLGP